MKTIAPEKLDGLSVDDLGILAVAPIVRDYCRQGRELAIARAELEHYRASMAEVVDMAGGYVGLSDDQLRARLGDIWQHASVCQIAAIDIPTNREERR